MNTTLAMVCRDLRNWFYIYGADGQILRQDDDFTIVFEELSPVDIPLMPGQFVRLIGGVFASGVYELSDTLKLSGARDENFTGTLVPLAIPDEFMELVTEIDAFINRERENPNTGITSERFQNYSYTRATGANGAPVTWREMFGGRLNVYRRLYEERVI